MRTYDSLRRRSDFQRVRARGRRIHAGHLLIVAHPARGDEHRTRIGFVIPSSVGGAVSRNRLRRRLHAILDALSLGRSADLVIVAHPGAAECGFGELRAEVRAALADFRA